MKNGWLTVAGYIFLLWGIIDVISKITLYGFWEFDFAWFCSVTLFVLAFGLILKSEFLLNSFLSMALVVQPVYALDYIWISFFNTPLNGSSLFAFQPGFRLIEFINNTRHLLMIPLGFYAVFTQSKESKKSYLFTFVFVIVILGSSYMFTPGYSNVNCVFKPCVKLLNPPFSGFKYFISFSLEMLILMLFVNFLINLLLRKFRNKNSYKKYVISIFVMVLCISFVSIIAGSVKYSKIPKYVCLEPDICQNCIISMKCKYVYGLDNNQTLIYTLGNNENKDYICDVYMAIYPVSPTYEKIANNSWIQSKHSYKIGQKLPYPEIDSGIKIKADCRKLE